MVLLVKSTVCAQVADEELDKTSARRHGFTLMHSEELVEPFDLAFGRVCVHCADRHANLVDDPVCGLHDLVVLLELRRLLHPHNHPVVLGYLQRIFVPIEAEV